MIGLREPNTGVKMVGRWWEELPAFWRWSALLGLFVITTAFTDLLRWGQLPATPYYPVVLLSIWLGTERQGYVLTVLCVVATISLSVLLRTPEGYAQEGLDSAVLALIAMVMIVAMHQRRSAAHYMKIVVYESGVIKALGNYALTRLTRDDMMKVIVRYLANSTDAACALVAVADAKNMMLTGYMDSNGFGRGPQPVTRSIADTFLGDVYTAGETRIENEIDQESRFMPVEGVPLRSVIATPLLLAGLPIGALLVGSVEAHKFRNGDVKLIEVLARTIAVPLYASRPTHVGVDRNITPKES